MSERKTVNVTKCVNGHFFDLESYPACPHCGGQAASDGQSVNTTETRAKRKGLFSVFRKKTSEEEKDTSQQFSQNENNIIPQDYSGYMDVKTDVMPVQESSDNEPEEKDNECTVKMSAVNSGDHTLDFWQDNSETSSDSDSNSVSDTGTNTEINDTESSVSEISSLSEAVKRASANSEGKTAGYFSSVAAEMNKNNSDASAGAHCSNPVVGWLVCIEGPHFGESFCIESGKNSLGRNGSNKIILGKDSAVSREKHAFIVYEPKKRNFFIQPGESSGLTYLNDDYITESKLLSAKDIVETGSSKLMFIPLCDNTFTWEDYISKG